MTKICCWAIFFGGFIYLGNHTIASESNDFDASIPRSPGVLCDRLAADPTDDDAKAAGVPIETLDAQAAEAACRHAIATEEFQPRYHYQLGRALFALGREDEGVMEILRASQVGYERAIIFKVIRELVGNDAFAKSPDRLDDVDRMVFIGYLLMKGFSGEEKKAEALSWFERASRVGSKEADFLIGYMYANAEGVAPDGDLARKYFKQASRSGLAAGSFFLGLMHRSGWGGDHDIDLGIKYLEQAAEKGYFLAYIELVNVFTNDIYDHVDMKKAEYWYCEAKLAGNDAIDAVYDLGFSCESG